MLEPNVVTLKFLKYMKGTLKKYKLQQGTRSFRQNPDSLSHCPKPYPTKRTGQVVSL